MAKIKHYVLQVIVEIGIEDTGDEKLNEQELRQSAAETTFYPDDFQILHTYVAEEEF